MKNNPIIWADYPDIDAIRVGDTYYMISTTMHFMPGCVILRSYDLIHWETVTHVYDALEDTPGQRLEGENHIYSKGMWAGSLRYHKGQFYVCFVANDTHKTYVYTATDINGPWTKHIMEGFYHDCSILFDDDDRVYLIHGNTEIQLVELKSDLSGAKPGGLNRIIVRDTEPRNLGYEGAHFYKINGKYYAFFIHALKSTGRRTQACFVADTLEGEFIGEEVFNDDMGYHNSGIAQGGIVDTPDGKWYSILFQDHGAVGRIPVIIPLRFENDFPVFDEKAPEYIELPSTRPGYEYKPLVGDDDFIYEPDELGNVCLKDYWQWNHIPDATLWSVTKKPGVYRIQSGKLSPNLVYAQNTLTQRTMGPACEAVVTLDGSGLREGDYAGLCLLISTYGLIALTKEMDQYYLVMLGRDAFDHNMFGKNEIDTRPAKEYARVPIQGSTVTLKAYANFVDNIDTCEFFYQEGDQWKKLGVTYPMTYKLDMFVGCRFGLFLYSTKEIGGLADFSSFRYNVL